METENVRLRRPFSVSNFAPSHNATKRTQNNVHCVFLIASDGPPPLPTGEEIIANTQTNAILFTLHFERFAPISHFRTFLRNNFTKCDVWCSSQTGAPWDILAIQVWRQTVYKRLRTVLNGTWGVFCPFPADPGLAWILTTQNLQPDLESPIFNQT